MPRDSGGNYTLAAGNPVASGTVISTTWANPTMDDLAVAMTESLSRAGNGGMLVPFQNVDGTAIAPGITFTNEPGSGLYRAGSNDVRMTIGSDDTTRWIDASAQTVGAQNPFQIWDGVTWKNALYQGGDPGVLANDTFLQGRNFADDGNIDLIKVNVNDLIQMGGQILIGTDASLFSSNEAISAVATVGSAFRATDAGSGAIKIQNTAVSDGDLISYMDTTGTARATTYIETATAKLTHNSAFGHVFTGSDLTVSGGNLTVFTAESVFTMIGTLANVLIQPTAAGPVQFGTGNNQGIEFITNTTPKVRISAAGSLTMLAEQIFASSALNELLPVYAFDGDADTGMYRGGADNLRWATAGVKRLEVDATGFFVFGNASIAAGRLSVRTAAVGDPENAAVNLTGSNGDFYATNLEATVGGPGFDQLLIVTATPDRLDWAFHDGAGGRTRLLSMDENEVRSIVSFIVDTGDLTVLAGSVSGNGGSGGVSTNGSYKMYGSVENGGVFQGQGSTQDITLLNGASGIVMTVATGTLDTIFYGTVTVASNLLVSAGTVTFNAASGVAQNIGLDNGLAGAETGFIIKDAGVNKWQTYKDGSNHYNFFSYTLGSTVMTLFEDTGNVNVRTGNFRVDNLAGGGVTGASIDNNGQLVRT